MSYWETNGASDEWYTPKYIFDGLGVTFDLDVASPQGHTTHVPARSFLTADGLDAEWHGFVWMNPPFGGRNGLVPWLERFVLHGNGIALVPDRTSAPWFQYIMRNAQMALFLSPKVKFERPDGSVGKSPSTGTVLFSIGSEGQDALISGFLSGLGALAEPQTWRVLVRAAA